MRPGTGPQGEDNMRERIFRYVKETYGTEPDYPFSGFPDYAVLRHGDSRKWFALIMNVPGEKLGWKGAERIEIVNVKLGDPMLADMLVRQPGYFYGYHMRRGSWVSILLDGTVSLEEVCRWVDESYVVTAPRRGRKEKNGGSRLKSI